METSARGIAEIISHEGLVPYRYRDSVGVDTLGIGHTAGAGAPDPKGFAFGSEIALAEVLTIFRRDLGRYERRVGKAVTAPLAQHEFDALVSFDLNTGRIHNATLGRKLNAGDRTGAIAEFDKWHIPPEIAGRRDKEKALFASGRYSGAGLASLYPADARGVILWGKGKRVDVVPVVDALIEAKAAGEGAANDRNAAVAAAGGATGTGAGGAIATPELPTDDASLKVFLVLCAIALAGVAAGFLVRGLARRAAAKAGDAKAARRLAAAAAE